MKTKSAVLKNLIILTVLSVGTTSALAGNPQARSTATLSVVQARGLSMRALQYAKSKNWNVSVAIVNAEGNLIHVQRGDGAFAGSIEASIQKAKTSSLYQRPTSRFMEALSGGFHPLATLPNAVALAGGQPILENGVQIGSIGVSGQSPGEDDEIALASIK